MTDKNLHFILQLTLNEDGWAYAEPKTDARIDFDIPLEMFEPKKLTELVEKRIKDLQAEFPEAIVKYTQRKAEEAREKAEQEAGVTV
jgi:hypothetical protein